MNPFTKGTKVRAIRDTKSYGAETPIKKDTVLEVSRTNEVDSAALFTANRPDTGGVYALAKDDFEPADATPAPLDKSKVRVSDTVTVTIAARNGTPEFEITGSVYGDEEPHGLAVGDYMLMHDRVTLTAHQPAPEPEPEPEWKPGTVAVATVRGMTNVRVMRLEPSPTDTRHHWVDLDGTIPDDSRVTDVRPLVVLSEEEARSWRQWKDS